MRNDGRKNGQIRDIKIETDYTIHAEGSVLYRQGNTVVLCNASVEDRVPPHVFGTGRGWVTAEYSMLPRATATRNQRDVSKLKLSPRSTEIQRLIARALRGAVDLEKLGERSIIVDCDVIQADGGTRCASVTGGFIALSLAVRRLLEQGVLKENPITKQVAALSVGIVGDALLCDLCYEEDCRAETDMNVIMTSNGGFVEIQGTAEGRELSRRETDLLLNLAEKGMQRLFAEQSLALSGKRKNAFLLATNNAHKVEEFSRIFSRLGLCLVTPRELGISCDPEENGDSFEQNALIKARAFYDICRIPTVADDSGLCVDALNGEPGIYSARYGGMDSDRARLDLLMKNMEGKTLRTARFVSAIACVMSDVESFTVTGTVEGKIADKYAGGGGFGYDPAFVPEGFDKTFGQMSAAEKDAVSHRARALEKFSDKIKEKI